MSKEKKAENFYQNLLKMESAEERPIHEIIKVDLNKFPPAKNLTPKKMQRKYKKLKRILGKHSFVLQFSDKLPIQEKYKYLTEVLLFEMEIEMFKGHFCIVTGCGGDCPSCFQMNYCDMENEC